MASKFGDQVRAFAEKAKQLQVVILRQSAQELMEQANTPEGQGGRMPVDTSFLRNSQAASTSGMPGSDAGVPALVLVKLEVGETVWMGWTAAYAMRIEHGFHGPDALGRVYAQPGKGFARAAAQNWPFIVQRVAAEVKDKLP